MSRVVAGVLALAKLADPRLLADAHELDEIVKTTPASFLISTVDTSEASTVEAMQLIAYQLLAGTDPLSTRIRRAVVTYIVPVEEPNLRCQWPVLHRLLFNAILLGRAAN